VENINDPKDCENIESNLIITKKDSIKSQYYEDMQKEIETYKENHLKEMNHEINRLKEFHMNEIQSFESKL